MTAAVPGTPGVAGGPAPAVPPGARALAGAFVWLFARTTRNRARAQLRRLRTPRNAIALVAGAVYIWYFLVRRPGGTALPVGTALASSVTALAAALGVALLAGYWWLSTADRSALAFSEAEVQLLFAAPIPRRALVHYKLLQAQLVILLNTLVWLVILGRGGPAHAPLLRALALWVLFSTLTLHRLGAALVRASVAEHGASGARRAAIPVAVAVALGAVLAWAVLTAVPPVTAAPDFAELVRRVELALGRPAARVVLLPFRWVVAPLFAATWRAWVVAMLPAVAILLAHYAWVLRTDAAFEEAAVEASRRRAERLARARDRTRGAAPARARHTRPWFPLAPTGRPAVAIAWKNILSITRAVRPLAVLLPVSVAVIAIALAVRPGAAAGGARAALAGVATGAVAMLVLFGPLWVRNDLRQDMQKLELLRAYPLSGRAIMAAEMVGSAAVLSAVHLALVAAALVLIPAGELPVPRTALFAAALVVLPAINAITLTLQNGAALLFPTWVRLGTGRRGGIEALGQNLLTGGASLVLLVLALLGPAVVASAVALALWGAGRWALVPAGLAALAVVTGEVVLLVRWLGRVFERTDAIE